MGLGAVGGQIDGQRMGIDGQRERRTGETADWGFQRMAQGCLFVFHFSLSSCTRLRMGNAGQVREPEANGQRMGTAFAMESG